MAWLELSLYTEPPMSSIVRFDVGQSQVLLSFIQTPDIVNGFTMSKASLVASKAESCEVK